MDWLTRHHAKVDCNTKEVIIESPGQERVVFQGERKMIHSCLISAMSAFKMIRKGCEAYLAHVVDTNTSPTKLENIPIVREFPDVFPDDLPGMPPDRDIEFTIETIPGTIPISIPPYLNGNRKAKIIKEAINRIIGKKVLSVQVFHHGERQYYLSKRRMEL